MKPTIHDALKLVAEHYGLSMPATKALMRRSINEKTLRDEFAMAALNGVLSNYDGNLGTSYPLENKNLAIACYAVADAMMIEREKGGAA